MWVEWDVALFRAIHHGMRHPWLDSIMMFLSEPGALKFPILILIGLLFLLRGRRGAIGVVVLALTIAAGDQLSSHILKPMFRRPRPHILMPDTTPMFGGRVSRSFPSTHAVNFSAAAPVVSAVFPQATVFAFAVAAAVSYSRVYVGDHYPIDVLAGMILGLTLGFLGRKAYRRAVRTLLERNQPAPVEGTESIQMSARGEKAPSGGP